MKQAQGKSITTLEGLGTPEKPHPVQAAFIAEQAAQCGYCANGMIMTAKALLDATPNPTESTGQTRPERRDLPLWNAHQNPARRAARFQRA